MIIIIEETHKYKWIIKETDKYKWIIKETHISINE